MKKIYLSLMLLGAMTFASCDMDKTEYGKLDDQTAISGVSDLRQFRNNIYTSLRSVTTGAWIYDSDIQMDEFHGLINNANREGILSNGLFNSSDSDIKGFWSGYYSVIASNNSLIEHAEELGANESLSAADKAAVTRYNGEAHFMRAYMYFLLADKFCQPYTQCDPSAAATGMPISLKYEPTGDISKYPSRSTLEETYAQIESDLKVAYDDIKAYELSGASDVATLTAPNAAYISSYAVEALQARVALTKGDWATAGTKAKDVISSGNYSLTTIDNYAKLWSEDEGTEVIFRPFQSTTELAGSPAAPYVSESETSADYIPTYGTLSLFASEDGDIRFSTFFKVYNLEIEGSQYQAYAFVKYPGNVDLRSDPSKNNFANMAKPFRLSEMYLIAAEAAARQNNISEANSYLNTFLKNRIDGYEQNNFSANTILSRILDERQKEFIGEGMRMSDVRRLGKGFTRTANHEENPSLDNVVVKAGRALTYSAKDYRLTWPIPKEEIDANPKLAKEQNPGY